MMSSSSIMNFPIDEIKKALSEFWDEQMDIDDDSSSFSLGPNLDSLTALVSLLTIQKILSVNEPLPVTLIQKGGYHTKAEFVNVLSSSVETYYASHIK